MRRALYNTFLQSDMEGGDTGYAVGTSSKPLSGLRVGYKTVKEICLGIRTGSKPGSGSWDDPYQAATAAQLDAMMLSLTDGSMAAAMDIPDPDDVKWIIRFRDGEFLTSTFSNGAGGWYLKPGWQMIGEGIGRTILTATIPSGAIPGGAASVITSSSSDMGGGILLEGFTVDCAWDEIPDALATDKIGGAILYGSGNVMRNMAVTRAYGHYDVNPSLLAESFGLMIQGGTANTAAYFAGKRNLMEYCYASGFLGDYGMGVVMAATGTMRDCHAKNYRAMSGTQENTHVAGLGIISGVADCCTAETCDIGVYCETVSAVRVTAAKLTDIYQIGVHFSVPSDQTPKDLWVEHSEIEMRDDGDIDRAWAIAYAPPTIAASAGGTLNNTLRLKVTGETPHDPTGNYGILESGAILEDQTAFLGQGRSHVNNRVDAAFKNDILQDTFCYGNRTLEGATIPAGDGLGQGLPDAFLTEVPPMTNDSIFGSLRSVAERTDPEGYWGFSIDLSSSYTILAGDTLQVSTKIDPSSESFICGSIQFATAGGVVGVNDLIDQNGLQMSNADLADYANGVFYSRVSELDAIEGELITKLVIGGSPTDSSGNPAGLGEVLFFCKSICIVDADGVVVRDIYSDQNLLDVTITAYSSSDVTGEACAPTFLPLPYTVPTTDPTTQWEVWDDGGTLKVSIVAGTANPDTSGAILADLETEVNQLKALLRTAGLLAT